MRLKCEYLFFYCELFEKYQVGVRHFKFSNADIYLSAPYRFGLEPDDEWYSYLLFMSDDKVISFEEFLELLEPEEKKLFVHHLDLFR